MPCLWMLGEFDAALEAARRAVELARTVGHPFSAAFALSYAALFHGLRGDMNTRKALAEEALALSQQHGLAAFTALAGILRGSALVALTERQEGLRVLHQALDVYAMTGSTLSSSYYSVLRANAYAESGRIDEAHAAIEAGLTAVESAQERFAEAELYRTRAVLGRAAGIADAAVEADFRRAIEIARQQGAKAWALHAAIGLAQHHEAHGARTDATAILEDVRREFAPGLVAPELEEADRLLAGIFSQ
jgi:predicted ATPase